MTRARPDSPRAILFDFDGVLAASHMLHRSAWLAAYKEQTGEELTGAAASRLSGFAPMMIAATLLGTNRTDERTTQLHSAKLEWMLARATQVELLPGAAALLRWCEERGLPHGIASNSPSSLVRAVLAHHGLSRDDLIVLGEECYTHPKPDPEPYLELAKALGEEEGCWVVEDSLPGIKAATRSRLGVVMAIAREDIPKEVVLEAGAYDVFDSPAALHELLMAL